MYDRGVESGTININSICNFLKENVGIEDLDKNYASKNDLDEDLVKLAEYMLKNEGDAAEMIVCRKLFLKMMMYRSKFSNYNKQ